MNSGQMNKAMKTSTGACIFAQLISIRPHCCLPHRGHTPMPCRVCSPQCQGMRKGDIGAGMDNVFWREVQTTKKIHQFLITAPLYFTAISTCISMPTALFLSAYLFHCFYFPSPRIQAPPHFLATRTNLGPSSGLAKQGLPRLRRRAWPRVPRLLRLAGAGVKTRESRRWIPTKITADNLDSDSMLLYFRPNAQRALSSPHFLPLPLCAHQLAPPRKPRPTH